MPEIRLEGITKYYRHEKRKIAAVRDIDLTIKQGDYLFITGSSGAGKSTLLQLIMGELRPDAGSIYFNQVNMSMLPLVGRRRSKGVFGYVPQVSFLMRKRTIYKNLEMVCSFGSRVLDGPAPERIAKALAMVGLGGVENRYPAELSRGECRRVELARAILNSPSVLVLDELTSNLDDDVAWDIFHLLEEFNRHGTTIIMATHAKNFVNMMCKRVITLVDGEIRGDVQNGRYGDIYGTSKRR